MKTDIFRRFNSTFFFLMRPSLNEIWIDLMGWYDQKVSAPSLGRWETKREGKVHPINKRRTSNPKKFWAVGSVSLIKLSFIRRNKHTSFVFQTVDSMNFFNFVSCWTKYVTQKKSSFFFYLKWKWIKECETKQNVGEKESGQPIEENSKVAMVTLVQS